MIFFYRTHVYVGSDHWVLMYVYNYTFLETLLKTLLKTLLVCVGHLQFFQCFKEKEVFFFFHNFPTTVMRSKHVLLEIAPGEKQSMLGG